MENKTAFDWKSNILASYIQIDGLLKQEFKIIYDECYNIHKTTNQELYNIKSKCNNKESIICVGGSDGLNTLLLVSCGSCFDILTTTKLNTWYFTPNSSFGFSSNHLIKQKTADYYDCDDSYINCKDSKRLSWNLAARVRNNRCFNAFFLRSIIPL